MKIQLLGKEAHFDSPATVLDILKSMAPEAVPQAMGCFCGGKVLELTELVSEDCRLHPIIFQNEEGRRIYERSLRFVLLMAVKRLYPRLHLRIEHSIGSGVYMRFLEQEATQQMAEALQAEMEKITKADLPFRREKWSREQAIAYFRSAGHPDKTRLLSYRPYDYFQVYRCGELTEYFYGAMLPSTGYVPHFQLMLHAPGLVLQFPSPQHPHRPSPFLSRPNILAAFRQQNEISGLITLCQHRKLTALLHVLF